MKAKALRRRKENFGPGDMGKRKFLNFLLGLTVISGFVGTLYTIFKFLFPPERSMAIEDNVIKIAKVSDIRPGRSLKFRYGRYPCLLVNYNGKFLAYGAICTHLACIVHWKDEDGCIMDMGEGMGDQIHCVCHAGHYDVVTGNVLAGPPPSRLPKMSLRIKGGEIFATGWDEPNYVKRISTYA
ncbi:MAG: ubiquinol-cytochrome c reductase iron-sulfur subunit [Thermodesulfobacteriota bacterium]